MRIEGFLFLFFGVLLGVIVNSRVGEFLCCVIPFWVIFPGLVRLLNEGESCTKAAFVLSSLTIR